MATQQGKKPVKKKPVKKRPHQGYEEERRPSSKKPASGKKAETKNKEKKKRGKILLFIAEIFVLLLMVVVLYGVLKTEEVGKVNIPEKDIVINEEVREKQETTMKGYRNIALFGVDSREGALGKNTRSDTIMIASINQDTGECKLVSVYRDTYLNLSNDSYNKCNTAYAKGGPKQAINMLNMNLDMNITDFITVGFEGLADTIDALGGVEIDVKESEISHLNNYQISMVGTTTDGKTFVAKEGVDYTPVTTAGRQTLNGLQATAYCRIRYVGDDFERTQRQRTVLIAISEKAKKASPAALNDVADKVFKEIYTSLDLSEILELLGDITKYEVVDQSGFPSMDMLTTGTIGSKGSCIVPKSLEDNVKWLHEFLFNDTDYEPSEVIKECSAKIAADTSAYVK
ncbi:MAG: LCP family protein [Lachnospiraceae bacterium]|nr:LCP family protein [Lachnospiraceae bacterium]